VIPAGVLVTHGAGGDSSHRVLVALEERLAERPGVAVRRFDFPYRRQGRRAPDRAPKLVAALVDEARRFADDLGVAPARLVIGGRSMGGRIASLAVAEGLEAAGLVLLSYPLHPPGRPERLRVEHWPDVDVPVLFCNGDRDPFGSPCCCRRTPTTARTSSSRSAAPRAARRPTCSPATSSRCTRATPNAWAGSSRCSARTPSDMGGFNEVTFVLKGDGVWSRMKHEGGPHRVQRVPVTESQGRVHTSSATVTVLPEAEEVEVEIDDERPRRSTSTARRAPAVSR
jgi:uncharacterized protein